MTGYGKAEGIVLGRTASAEIRSVNGRYLELTIRLPKEWAHHESSIRDRVREKVSRGSVTLYVRSDEESSRAQTSLNYEGAATFVQQLQQLQSTLGIEGAVTLDHVLRYPDLFVSDSTSVDKDEEWKALDAIVTSAIENLGIMRLAEGAEMKTDMTMRLARVQNGLEAVEAKSIERIPIERERLRERIRQFTTDAEVEEQRLQFEIAMLADKIDVTEECVRLRSHLKHFLGYMDREDQVGRKLNFLLQEMNREVNTIGSKCNDSEVAVIVVEMKEELERMREQVQNVE